MTVKEMAAVMDYLKTSYPYTWEKGVTDERKTISVWADQFADDDPKLVQAAVKSIVATSTSDYAPTIGQVKAEMYRLSAGGANAQEMWTHIRKAISNSGYHSADEFALLSPIERKVVGSPRQLFDWSQMDVETLDSVVASNIQRALRDRMETERYQAALPISVRDRLEGLVKRIEGGEPDEF